MNKFIISRKSSCLVWKNKLPWILKGVFVCLNLKLSRFAAEQEGNYIIKLLWLFPSDRTSRITLLRSKGKSNLSISPEKSFCATDHVCQAGTGATENSPNSSDLLSQPFWPWQDPTITKYNLFWFWIGFASVSTTHWVLKFWYFSLGVSYFHSFLSLFTTKILAFLFLVTFGVFF